MVTLAAYVQCVVSWIIIIVAEYMCNVVLACIANYSYVVHGCVCVCV